MSGVKNIVATWMPFMKYNMKVIFGGKFIWFFLGALALFMLTSVMVVLEVEVLAEEHIFSSLMLPSLILMFYPTVFGIQNDADAKMMEVIFGIPDYRYKIWLVRLLMSFVIEFVAIVMFATFSNYMLLPISIFEMAGNMMYIALFLGSLSFLFSTLFRSGTGTAVAVIIVGVIFMILSDSLDGSMWNVFLNPYGMPDSMSEAIWDQVIVKNRIFMVTSYVVTILWSLFNLQSREKFARM